MKTLDKYLRDVRIARAKQFVRQDDVVLDVGCADGVMFEKWCGLIKYGYGVEPLLEEKVEAPSYTLLPGYFPAAMPKGIKADVITMLAVLEHIPTDDQATLGEVCHDLLEPGGRIVITVPSPKVDDILDVLVKFKLIYGMSADEHYGFEPSDTEQVFREPFFRLLGRQSFQFGLNNLFVFERI